eukprot:330054-Amphidinium_carterae.1
MLEQRVTSHKFAHQETLGAERELLQGSRTAIILLSRGTLTDLKQACAWPRCAATYPMLKEKVCRQSFAQSFGQKQTPI